MEKLHTMYIRPNSHVIAAVPFNQITPTVAHDVAAVMKKFTDEGVQVWLRFGHEMNWYVKDSPNDDASKNTYHGTAPEFLVAWKNMYEANCKGNEKVKCFWSPQSRSDVVGFTAMVARPGYDGHCSL
ncbi:glycoside hydrolase family 26 protein [Pleomassaria siparia CBS 279.74]|uniref:Glycoside hydrolase family 26 protein n=1 Tax=Pleomassaria siparia CBS 279.74 TaxID=1314801 RepID=A0A6G1KLQ6_9PLEO|nr:glycoside hydrolase family 26 protein [Pleomassaria siparia CBS 279.74]